MRDDWMIYYVTNWDNIVAKNLLNGPGKGGSLLFRIRRSELIFSRETGRQSMTSDGGKKRNDCPRI